MWSLYRTPWDLERLLATEPVPEPKLAAARYKATDQSAQTLANPICTQRRISTISN